MWSPFCGDGCWGYVLFLGVGLINREESLPLVSFGWFVGKGGFC